VPKVQGGGTDCVPPMRTCPCLEVGIPANVQTLCGLRSHASRRGIDDHSNGAIVGAGVAGQERDGQVIIDTNATQEEQIVQP